MKYANLSFFYKNLRRKIMKAMQNIQYNRSKAIPWDSVKELELRINPKER